MAGTDGPAAGYIPDQWVVLKNGTACFLPPLPGSVQLFSDPQVIAASNGVAAATVYLARWTGTQPAATPVSSASFVDGLELVGYHATELAPGQPVTVTQYWRRRQSLPADVQLFTQILDRNGNAIAAIHDWPLHGVYRVRAWQQDEVMPLSYTLNTPPMPRPARIASSPESSISFATTECLCKPAKIWRPSPRSNFLCPRRTRSPRSFPPPNLAIPFNSPAAH